MSKERALMLDDDKPLNEKFASKKQQGYFYAKCGDGKTKEQKKWCKMADEFSDSMSKKDWKKLPEKKKPKKEAVEENKIVSLIKEKENPRMTKKGLIEYIKKTKIIKTTSKKEIVSEQFGIKNSIKQLRYFKGERGGINKVFKYLTMFRDSGLENMMGMYPVLNWTKEDLHRYLYGMSMDPESLERKIEEERHDEDGFENEESMSNHSGYEEDLEIINYLLDNKQEIRDILIRVALRKSEAVGDHSDGNVQRHFEQAAREAFMIWVTIISV